MSSIFVYLIKTSHFEKLKKITVAHNIYKTNIKTTSDHEYYPKGDWMQNTIDYKIINGEILCVVLLEKKIYMEIFLEDCMLIFNNPVVYLICIVMTPYSLNQQIIFPQKMTNSRFCFKFVFNYEKTE